MKCQGIWDLGCVTDCGNTDVLKEETAVRF